MSPVDAPEGYFGTFEEMFSTMFPQTVPDDAEMIPREELRATFFNGRGSINHDKCGCPGYHLLQPTTNKKWLCSNCKRYTTPEIAAEVIAYDREESKRAFAKAHPDDPGFAATMNRIFLGEK